jgi:hypothetical protein
MDLYLHACFFLLSGELMVPDDGVHSTKVFIIGGSGAQKRFVVQEMLLGHADCVGSSDVFCLNLKISSSEAVFFKVDSAISGDFDF